MTDALSSSQNPEYSRAPESLFPFAPETVVQGLINLQNSSNQMLEMVVHARGPAGPADGLYHNLPFDDLIEWHQAENDFTPNGALLYRAGLLYGIDLANQVAQHVDVSERLTLTNPIAYEQALDYLKESYRGLDDQTKPEWQRQKDRELLYTGSDILTLANAALDDTVRRRLAVLGASVVGDGLAQHVGIVDGAILVDAYRAFNIGQTPRRFDHPVVEYVPTYNHAIHKPGDAVDLYFNMSADGLEELLQLASLNDRQEERIGELEDGTRATGVNVFVQLGSNNFGHAVHVTGIENPRVKFKRVNMYGIPGALLDLVAIQLDQAGKYLPIAYATGLLCGLYVERKKVQMKRDKIQKLGIALIDLK